MTTAAVSTAEDGVWDRYIDLYSWLCGAFEAVVHEGPLADLDEDGKGLTSPQARSFANAVLDRVKEAGWVAPISDEAIERRVEAFAKEILERRRQAGQIN